MDYSKILYEILILTSISAVLSLLIVVAKAVLQNYGDCEIDINGKRKVVVKGGSSLLTSLADENIFIPSACGGRGTCGACKCIVTDGGGPVLPTEKPFFTAKELAENNRLACQVKVKNNIRIEIPEEIFNIRKFKAKVAKIEDYTYDIKGVSFDLLEPKAIDFKAGQYVQIRSPRYGKIRETVTRAYSISSKPSNKELQLIIRKVPDGICTTWVHDFLKLGQEVEITGPYGDFFIRDTQADIIFVAGGSGKAPIKSMLEDLQEKGSKRKMSYFFGAKTTKDLYLTEYIESFSKVFPDFTYYPILSHSVPEDNWQGRTGWLMPFFPDAIRDPKNTEAYLCGSPGMIAAITKSLTGLGIPEDKIYYDSF
ncbi:MAG: FAD-binding oxidoreductase [Candidatus Cloacimonadales bacterium]